MEDLIEVACCQLAPCVGRLEENLPRVRAAITEAVAGGAQLVVVPELATSGYVFRSVEEAREAAIRANGPELAAWAAEAARGSAVVVGGFCELGEDGRLYNSCALADAGGVRAVYRKVHLWEDETRWFDPGTERAPVVETHLGRIGLAICYDIEFPELTRGLALRGAELLAMPTNWPRGWAWDRDVPILVTLARSTAYLNRVYVAVCDRGGSERGLQFEGGSVIAGPDGRVLAGPPEPPGAGGATLQASCDLAQARDKGTGKRNDAFADRRPELYETGLVRAPE
ncbi:MAG TPA: nitrilase-related carbon-nitrogen hydrolase [Solirubrobacteraceae bacterium]|nr:nitrilase-related carbon-nitrogen hydrolase [Solirubrobacteraceae bacterium]